MQELAEVRAPIGEGAFGLNIELDELRQRVLRGLDAEHRVRLR